MWRGALDPVERVGVRRGHGGEVRHGGEVAALVGEHGREQLALGPGVVQAASAG